MCLCFVVETENYLCKELFLLWVYSDSNENKSCKTKLVPKFLKFLLESFHALCASIVRWDRVYIFRRGSYCIRCYLDIQFLICKGNCLNQWENNSVMIWYYKHLSYILGKRNVFLITNYFPCPNITTEYESILFSVQKHRSES